MMCISLTGATAEVVAGGDIVGDVLDPGAAPTEATAVTGETSLKKCGTTMTLRLPSYHMSSRENRTLNGSFFVCNSRSYSRSHSRSRSYTPRRRSRFVKFTSTNIHTMLLLLLARICCMLVLHFVCLCWLKV